MDGQAGDAGQGGRSDISAAASSLSEEHAALGREVTTRAEAVLRKADEGHWPQSELPALVDYLHLEVLRQVVDEEWLLFRAARHAPDELARLRRDHLELRLIVEALAQAQAGDGSLTPKQLATTTRDLLVRLDAHFAAEEEVLSDPGAATSTASLGSQPHEWYTLAEGPVIDLDQLPGRQGADAVLARLLRLDADERVEVSASTELGPVWQRLARADPGGYGVIHLDRGPPLWRLAITRRPTS